MKQWIKKNWKDPVWSQVFAWTITGIIYLFLVTFWSIVQSVYSNVSFLESFNNIIVFLSKKLFVPIWLLLLLFIFLIVYLFKGKLNIKNRKTEKKVNKVNPVIEKGIESSKIIDVKSGMNSSINGTILGKDNGVCSIWAEVADIHNIIQDNTKFFYIASYASFKGKDLKNPAVAKYPNAWAICRVTPSQKDHVGSWRFWCNDNSIERNVIEYSEVLNNGWHLFSVAWSKKNNYIKFIIDKEIIGENEFELWPTDFNHSIRLGNWVEKMNAHSFNSKLGGFQFIESEFDIKIIENLIAKKEK